MQRKTCSRPCQITLTAVRHPGQDWYSAARSLYSAGPERLAVITSTLTRGFEHIVCLDSTELETSISESLIFAFLRTLRKASKLGTANSWKGRWGTPLSPLLLTIAGCDIRGCLRIVQLRVCISRLSITSFNTE